MNLLTSGPVGGFGSSSGGFGSAIGSALGQAALMGLNYTIQKKQLKRMNRLQRRISQGFGGTVAGNVGTIPTSMGGSQVPTMFLPSSTVPAVGSSTGSLAGGLLGGLLGGLGSGLLPSLDDVIDAVPGGLEEGGTGFFGPDLFRPTASSARQRMIDAPHPTTGERVFWRPVGRPILFAGDLALLRRTNKTIRRFAGPARVGSARRVRRFRRR